MPAPLPGWWCLDTQIQSDHLQWTVDKPIQFPCSLNKAKVFSSSLSFSLGESSPKPTPSFCPHPPVGPQGWQQAVVLSDSKVLWVFRHVLELGVCLWTRQFVSILLCCCTVSVQTFVCFSFVLSSGTGLLEISSLFEGIVWYFGNYAYLLSYHELEEKISTIFIPVWQTWSCRRQLIDLS